MQVDPSEEQLKAEMLAVMNEMRVLIGKEPLKTYPDRSCAFCGTSEEEGGALFRSDLIGYIHICRVCTGKAQRSFITILKGGKS
jgi:hypothetical protein